MKETKQSLVLRMVAAAVLLAAGSMLPLFAQAAGTPGAAQEAVAAALPTQAGQAKADVVVVKSYELKYIGASEFMRSAKFYVLDSSGTEKSLTVRIMASHIPAFEALLKKLDIDKKSIQFKVYAILASQQEFRAIDPQLPSQLKAMIPVETKEIADKELKKVLDEMKGIWNFRHFSVESPSFLLAKDGSGINRSRLVGYLNAELMLMNVQLRGEDAGKRIISVGQVTLSQKTAAGSENLINTSDITFKENGYLVVGVSGMSDSWFKGALILVISAEVK